MKNFSLFFLAFFAFFIPTQTHAQKLDFQMRYFSEIRKAYPRVDAHIPLTEKLNLCGGLSEDGLQMVTLAGGYAFAPWLHIKLGTGYHKQNGLHGVFGIHTEYEAKKWTLEGYINGYIDHKSLYASEIEFLKKFDHFDLGIATDIEYGKYLPLWNEVKPEILHEELFLGGPVVKYHIHKYLSCKILGMFGQEKVGHHPNVFACKLAFGVVLHHKKHHF